MTSIRLHNTKTRRKEDFAPIDPQNVRMYVCGPTVYDRAHLGNARPVVVFDVLFRLLRHVYGAEHVTYVRNFTDVDDKINAAALARQQSGDPRSLEALIAERTDETIAWYHADMDALGALRPTHEPRATGYIPQMVAMIESLIASGHAYAKAGHALFRVRSYAQYGALSGRSVDDMIAGARVEVAPFKEDPMDFVLWKPSSDQEPGWESPWGRGRPGWHIECSAMSHELLGPSFDIHGGGLDLQFPHHENEIAQSRCAHPEAGFANVWMHNEMLQVEGRKMSKSLGNFFTVLDLLFGEGIPGEVIRYVLLLTHYRKPMDWTHKKAKDAEKTLRKWHYICLTAKPSKQVPTDFLDALSDDLNTPQAIAILHRYANNGDAANLLSCANVLGFLHPETSLWFDPDDHLQVDDDARIHRITSLRIQARAAGRFDLSDELRDSLIEAGVAVFDHKLTSGSFREPDALRRFAQAKVVKALATGDNEKAFEYIALMRSAGFSLSIGVTGSIAVTGFDEVVYEAHFEQFIEKALAAADEAQARMDADL